MKKNEEKKEFKLTEAAEYDILSKKILSKFYSESLFVRLAHIDYEGCIRGQGDAVQMLDHTMITVDRAIPIEEKRDPEIFKDITLMNLVTARIAKQLQVEVEKTIVKVGNMSYGRKLYFVSQMVPMGGFAPRDYKMKFVYGFKIA